MEKERKENNAFVGVLEKEIVEDKPQWFFRTDSGEKLPLSKIYDENNKDTLKLKEGSFYKNLISDNEGGFIVLPWQF